MAFLISLNQTTAFVSSSSCKRSWTPSSVDTWKTPFRLDLTAAHSMVAPFRSTHNSGLFVVVVDDEAVEEPLVAPSLLEAAAAAILPDADSLKMNRKRSVRTTQEDVQFLRIFFPFSVSFVFWRTPCRRTLCSSQRRTGMFLRPFKQNRRATCKANRGEGGNYSQEESREPSR